MLNVYIFIYIVYALLVYFIFIINCKVRFRPKHALILLLILVLLNSIIGAVKPDGTQDTKIYNAVYKSSLSYVSNISINSFRDIIFNRSFYNVELFYVILMALFRYFFDSPVLFYFTQGIISNLAMIAGLYMLCEYSLEIDTKEEKDKFLGGRLMKLYNFYLLFCGILYTSSAIRDGLSISLGMVAIGNLLLKKRRLLSYVLFIISVLIHSTSIVLVLIYIILKVWNFKISRNWTIVLCGLLPIIYIAKIGKYTVGLVAQLVTVILQTLNIQAFYSYISNLDYQLPLREGYLLVLTAILLVLSFKNDRADDRKNDKLIVVVLCGLYMFAFAYPIEALARLLYMFILFIIPIVMNKTKFSNLVQLLSLLYLVPQYVYVFSYLK